MGLLIAVGAIGGGILGCVLARYIDFPWLAGTFVGGASGAVGLAVLIAIGGRRG